MGKNLESFSYLNRSNLGYIEQLYQQYKANPDAVENEWKLFFEGLEFAQNFKDTGAQGLSEKELRVYNLINAYRDYGHFEASLDPLASLPPVSPELSLAKFHLQEADLEETFQAGAFVGRPGAKLKEIIAHLKRCYCQTLSVQVAEALPRVREWFINVFERENEHFKLTDDEKKAVFEQLTRTESLEKFIGSRFVGAKRFSIEGADAMIPMLEALVVRGTPLGLQEMVIGMAHRGRLNVLANFMGKAVEVIFAEFAGLSSNKLADFDGDVKYHLGYSSDKDTPNGPCHISLAFNPSHLECVDPVVCGMTRAKQRRRMDTRDRKKVIPVLIHGDAAFAGQGVVAETLQISQLSGYRVGGTIHIIIDNQVGFTTNPESSRSSPYSSDVAKSLQIPVLHVNGDDPEACVRAMDIAVRFRQEFSQDIVINMICYRRFGHNEGDEPSFTQPLMYQTIKSHPTLRELYGKKLIKDGVIDQAFYESFYQQKIDNLQVLLDKTKQNPPVYIPPAFEGFWKGLRRGTREDFVKEWPTGAKASDLQSVSEILTTMPQGFSPLPKLKKIVEDRKSLLDRGQVDWGLGELLAYGTLMKEGTSVRLSGQDCGRGTFSHRHSVWNDIQTGEAYVPLKTIGPEHVEFCVYDSPLSEMAVLGFEYGNAISDPTFLTIWEAQFGDFANGAQIIIDQFLVSGETKWYRMNGLVLLLPHGYEGQGPEHSSARLERFLQMCAQDNIQVCNCTTPAQIFHVLRRQIHRDFRKPLIIMSPKSLLRHPKVISNIKELEHGHFQEILPDLISVEDKKVERLVLCSGKLFYDIDKYREMEKPQLAERTRVIRIEQLYPYPEFLLEPMLKKLSNLKTIIWAQEEPANMGAQSFIWPLLTQTMVRAGLKGVELRYAGRNHRASPATGSAKVHEAEQLSILTQCFQK